MAHAQTEAATLEQELRTLMTKNSLASAQLSKLKAGALLSQAERYENGAGSKLARKESLDYLTKLSKNVGLNQSDLKKAS